MNTQCIRHCNPLLQPNSVTCCSNDRALYAVNRPLVHCGSIRCNGCSDRRNECPHLLHYHTMARNIGKCCLFLFVANRTLRTDVFNPNNGDRFRFANTAIVITDGQSNVDESLTAPEAQLLKGFADVIAVGVTNDIDYDELTVGSFFGQ